MFSKDIVIYLSWARPLWRLESWTTMDRTGNSRSPQTDTPNTNHKYLLSELQISDEFNYCEFWKIEKLVLTKLTNRYHRYVIMIDT